MSVTRRPLSSPPSNAPILVKTCPISSRLDDTLNGSRTSLIGHVPQDSQVAILCPEIMQQHQQRSRYIEVAFYQPFSPPLFFPGGRELSTPLGSRERAFPSLTLVGLIQSRWSRSQTLLLQ